MTVLPASLHFTNFKMLLALFLVRSGIAAKEPQAGETTIHKLDTLLLLAEQERVWLSEQNLVARLGSIILEVQSVELIIQAATEFNKMLNQLVEENKTLKGRQAAAAILQVCQFLLVIIYLFAIIISYIVKRVHLRQAKQLEENLEMMENRLQQRETQRRSAARPPPKAQ